mgnify:CR=1 FL=1
MVVFGRSSRLAGTLTNEGVFDKITGKVVTEQNPGEEHQIGPSAEEQKCMKKCVIIW